MTCIVGLIEKDNVYIGGDSASIDSNYSITISGSKVFKNGDFLLGVCGSRRIKQLLMFNSLVKRRPQYDRESDLEYLVNEFIENLRDILKKGGCMEVERNKESGGTFLLGYKNNLYTIYSDFQIMLESSGYAACGSGKDIALGSLYTSKNYKCISLTPEQRIMLALEAAEYHNSGVRNPFDILIL